MEKRRNVNPVGAKCPIGVLQKLQIEELVVFFFVINRILNNAENVYTKMNVMSARVFAVDDDDGSTKR